MLVEIGCGTESDVKRDRKHDRECKSVASNMKKSILRSIDGEHVDKYNAERDREKYW